MTIVLYYSLFTIFSYLLSNLGLPLTRLTYLIVAVISLICCSWNFFAKHFRLKDLNSAVKKMEAKPHYSDPERSLITYLISHISYLIILVPSLLMFLMLYLGLGSYLTPPNNHDVPNHYYFITQILQTQSLKPELVLEGHTQNTWYMFGFHNFIAGLMQLFQIGEVNSIAFPIVWLMLSLFPLTVYRFSLTTTGNRQISLIASFISLTFPMFPVTILGWGGWPLSLGIILLFSALTETLKLFNDIGNEVSIFPLLLILNALFLTHTTEIIFYLILIFPALIIHCHQALILLKKFWFTLPLNLFLLLPLLLTGTNRINSTISPQIFEHFSLSDTLSLFTFIHTGLNHDYLFSFLAFIGLVIFLKNRHYPLLTLPALTLLNLWSIRQLTPFLDSLNHRLFPLFEADRIYSLLSGFFAPLASLALTRLARRFAASYPPKTRSRIVQNFILAIVGLGLLLPISKNIQNLKTHLEINTTVRPNDLELIQRHQSLCSVYLNDDYADAGRFIPFFSTSQVLLPGPTEILPDLDARLDLLHLLATGSSEFCHARQTYPFDCVYFGARDTYKQRHLLSLDQLNTHPQLKLVENLQGSAIYLPQCP